MNNDENINNAIISLNKLLIFLVQSGDIKSFQQNSDLSYTLIFHGNKSAVITTIALKKGYQYLLKQLYDISLDASYNFQNKSMELYYSILIYEICKHVDSDIKPIFFEEEDDTVYFYDENDNKIAFSKGFGSFKVNIYNKFLKRS